MGTSTNYKAPTSPQWRNLKTKVTRLTNQGRLSSSNVREIVQDFMTVNFDLSRGASIGGITAGRRAAQNIGGFFSSIAAVGFSEAFEQAGLGSLEGKSVHEIWVSLLDYLCGTGSTIDEVDARQALSDLMSPTFDADSSEEVEETINAIIHGEALDDLIRRFFGYYIYHRFCRVFYNRLATDIGHMQANECIDEIQDYIFRTLKYVTRYQEVSQIDWNGNQGEQIVNDILQGILGVFRR